MATIEGPKHPTHGQCVGFLQTFLKEQYQQPLNPTHGSGLPTAVGGRFRSSLQHDSMERPESHPRECVDRQIVSITRRHGKTGIPRTGVRGSFRSFLQHDGMERSESHPRQWVEGSDSLYNTTAWKNRNPTHGSAWIVQIVSTTRPHGKAGIPRTGVRGSFRSFLLNGNLFRQTQPLLNQASGVITTRPCIGTGLP